MNGNKKGGALRAALSVLITVIMIALALCAGALRTAQGLLSDDGIDALVEKGGLARLVMTPEEYGGPVDLEAVPDEFSGEPFAEYVGVIELTENRLNVTGEDARIATEKGMAVVYDYFKEHTAFTYFDVCANNFLAVRFAGAYSLDLKDREVITIYEQYRCYQGAIEKFGALLDDALYGRTEKKLFAAVPLGYSQIYMTCAGERAAAVEDYFKQVKTGLVNELLAEYLKGAAGYLKTGEGSFSVDADAFADKIKQGVTDAIGACGFSLASDSMRSTVKLYCEKQSAITLKTLGETLPGYDEAAAYVGDGPIYIMKKLLDPVAAYVLAGAAALCALALIIINKPKYRGFGYIGAALLAAGAPLILINLFTDKLGSLLAPLGLTEEMANAAAIAAAAVVGPFRRTGMILAAAGVAAVVLCLVCSLISEKNREAAEAKQQI